MSPKQEDNTGALEQARERLYKSGGTVHERTPLAVSSSGPLPHEWEENSLPNNVFTNRGKRKVRLAGVFFIIAFVFFIIALGVAGYFFYFGGNSVSVDKITIDIQGPTTIAAGDTVPLSLTVINKNPVAIDNAIIEINFPTGTRNASNTLEAYPRYIENLGTLPSGATITRSIKAVIFGGAGQTLSLPISLSYGTAGSNATFVKKSSYALIVSSTPLSVSVDTLTETVSGKPITLTLTVRSNATVPLDNVVVAGTFPFGFSVTSSSMPLNNSNFSLGTLTPGAVKTITLTGTLQGQNNEQRVFRFTVGTAKSVSDQTPGITYMTQDATVLIVASFINTNLAINGDTSPNVVVSPGRSQNVTLSYTNTLSTSITNATVEIAISGSAVDYDNIQTSNGFYRSADHTIVFSRDTDPALTTLAPGASGISTFTFPTLASGLFASSPTITFTISVSGTRVGQSNVPEKVSAVMTKTAKVITTVTLVASSLHNSGPFISTGPIPPQANQVTTYTIVWNAQNAGNTVANGVVSAILPSYVSYTGKTSGIGSFSYNTNSHTVTWNIGDLTQGSNVQGAFQVSLTPSTSQKGSTPQLTGSASFSGHDRFAGVQVEATADPVTTETLGDPGYISTNGTVQ